MGLDEYEFRAESCRRVAKTLRDPEVVAALHDLARRYDELAARLRAASEGEAEPAGASGDRSTDRDER